MEKKAQVIVKKFFENNMIHMLGSDVHRQNTIYPKIPEILMEINELIGEEKLKELTTINPRLVLQNKRIDIEEPHKIELSFKEKLAMLKRRVIKNNVNEFSKKRLKYFFG